MQERTIKPIPKRPLGKTGHQVTIYGLGGLFTVARHDRHDEAVEIVNDYPYDCALITLNAARAAMDDPEDLDRFFRLAQEKEVGDKHG